MHILEVNAFNYRRGGSETVFLNTSEELLRRGHKVSRFTLRWDENNPDPNEEYFPHSKATRRGLFRQVKNMINYFYHFEAARKLQKLIDKEKPEIAHVHLIWGQLSSSILKVLKHNNIPVVHTAHDYRLICPAYTFINGRGETCTKCDDGNFRHCVGEKCCRGSLMLSAMMAAEQWFRNTFFCPSNNIDGIVYVSDFAGVRHKALHEGAYSPKSVRIYNFSRHIDDEVTLPSAVRYYLYSGRLSKEKGISTLIDAFASMPEKKLIIAGGGALSEAVKERIATEKIGNIILTGHLDSAELDKLIRGAYFTIVPSEWFENNPMSVIESFSLSTPVIASDIGGLPEIVSDGLTGFLSRQGDSRHLVETINKADALNVDEYMKMQIECLDFAKRKFDKNKNISELEDFFELVLNDYSKSDSRRK